MKHIPKMKRYESIHYQANTNDINEKRMAESLKNKLSAILIRQGNDADALPKILKCVSDNYKTIPTDFIRSQWLQNVLKIRKSLMSSL